VEKALERKRKGRRGKRERLQEGDIKAAAAGKRRSVMEWRWRREGETKKSKEQKKQQTAGPGPLEIEN